MCLAKCSKAIGLIKWLVYTYYAGKLKEICRSAGAFDITVWCSDRFSILCFMLKHDFYWSWDWCFDKLILLCFSLCSNIFIFIVKVFFSGWKVSLFYWRICKHSRGSPKQTMNVFQSYSLIKKHSKKWLF